MLHDWHHQNTRAYGFIINHMTPILRALVHPLGSIPTQENHRSGLWSLINLGMGWWYPHTNHPSSLPPAGVQQIYTYIFVGGVSRRIYQRFTTLKQRFPTMSFLSNSIEGPVTGIPSIITKPVAKKGNNQAPLFMNQPMGSWDIYGKPSRIIVVILYLENLRKSPNISREATKNRGGSRRLRPQVDLPRVSGGLPITTVPQENMLRVSLRLWASIQLHFQTCSCKKTQGPWYKIEDQSSL